MNLGHYFIHDITYWAPLGTGADGKRTFATPVLITGRWNDGGEVTTNYAGAEVYSVATIYTGMAVKEQGFLYPGTSVESSPLGLDTAREIARVSRSQDLKGHTSMYAAQVV